MTRQAIGGSRPGGEPEEFKRRVEAIFNGSARRYAAEREVHAGFRRQAAWLVDAARAGGGGRVLEVGCGAGSLLEPMHRAGLVPVGVDRSWEMTLRYAARARSLQATARVARADAEHLPFADGTFNVIVALGLLEYLPSPSRFLGEAARLLARNGRLLLSVPSSISPHALAGRAFAGLPSGFRARLLGRDPGRPLQSLRSRPLRLGRLSAELRHRGFTVRRWRFSEFLFFPLDRLAPVWSRRLADLLEPWGGVPILSRLGAQILVEAERLPASPAAA